MSSVSQFSPNTGIAAGSPLVASLLNGLVQSQSYVLSGGVPPTSVSLVVAMPATVAVVLATSGTYSGVAIWNSVAGGNITLPASKDNYIDLQSTTTAYPFTGSYVVTSVANGAGAPALASNSVRLCKVVTSGTAATSVDSSMQVPAPVGAAQMANGALLETTTGNASSSTTTFTGVSTFTAVPNLATATLVLPRALTVVVEAWGNFAYAGTSGTITIDVSVDGGTNNQLVTMPATTGQVVTLIGKQPYALAAGSHTFALTWSGTNALQVVMGGNSVIFTVKAIGNP